MAVIRHAAAADASAIAALWNPVIRESVATFNSVEKSPEDVAAMVAASPGAFWLTEEAELLGFARFAKFRAGSGYAHTFEHTIVLAPAARGRGHGRILMTQLIEAVREAEGHVLVAAISGENLEGMAFHRALGFQIVGHMPQVGYKSVGGWTLC